MVKAHLDGLNIKRKSERVNANHNPAQTDLRVETEISS